MARIDKLERARQEGMSYALEVAKKKGIEGLEEELRMRGITGIPIGVSRSAVDKVIENIKNQTLDTVNILTAMTLHDEFGFGAARIERFRKRFDFKTECLMEDYVTWPEMIDALKKETGLEYAIPKRFVCEYCNKEFVNTQINSRFCSNKCKSAWRRKSGIDDITKICFKCGKEYIANKYQKTKYCPLCKNKKH